MNKLRMGICLLIFFASAATLAAQCPPDTPPLLRPFLTCQPGRDANGAYFLIARPALYNHRLILWNHGYNLAPPKPLSFADLGPVAALLAEGYAVAASSYRPDAIGLGGWAVADGAEDTENLRQTFVRIFGQPRMTLVVGASEGGIITATMAEKFGTDAEGELVYDGVLPLCGPLAGGRVNWYGGFDLRAVYQYYCQNLPRPNEMQYPLQFGLAPNNTLTQADVVGRINQCTGVLQPPATRTPPQQQNLANILSVTKIPENFLVTDMIFATFALQELVLVRTRGLSPVTNLDVWYSGSTDDDALNAGVYRTGSHPDAVAWLSNAYDPTGDVAMPTLTSHTIGDGLVVVENEGTYLQTRESAGTDDNLFQTYINANGHCEFSPAEFLANFQGLVNWVQSKHRPTQRQIVGMCQAFRPIVGGSCNFNTAFEPDTIDSRIVPREP